MVVWRLQGAPCTAEKEAYGNPLSIRRFINNTTSTSFSFSGLLRHTYLSQSINYLLLLDSSEIASSRMCS